MSTGKNPFTLEDDPRIIALLPARYNSSRLPGKPLIEICGCSVIRRTYQQVEKSIIDSSLIYVVTDDDRIENHVESWDGNVIRVDMCCLNGTVRIAHALSKLALDPPLKDTDIVVNVQGDEPCIDPANIDYLISQHQQHQNPDITTMHQEKKSPSTHLMGENSCKIVTDINHRVLYGSRAMIPNISIAKTQHTMSWKEHVGVFAFRPSWLTYLLSHPPTPLQLAEDIEWLQTLELGGRMLSFQAPTENERGVNTPEDVKYLTRILS